MDSRDCSEHTDQSAEYIPVSIRILKVFRELPRDRKKQKNTESGSLLAMMIYEDSRQTWLVSTAEPLHFVRGTRGSLSACNSNTHAYLQLCILEDSATASWYVRLCKNYRGKQFSKESFDNG